MLVILTENQVLAAQQVCQGCLLADHQGQPRWYQGRPCAGQLIREAQAHEPAQYECPMGFRMVEVR